MMRKKEPRGRSVLARDAMGNGDRNNDASADASVDGWFDLLDEELEREATARPAGARTSNVPIGLAGLNEISNKVTPVMLAPVSHLLPIEPSIAPEPARDAWDDDLVEEPFGGGLFSEPAANGVQAPVVRPSLPPLVEAEDEHGQEFFEFGEPSQERLRAPMNPAAPSLPQHRSGFETSSSGAEGSDALPPLQESSRSSFPPATGRLSSMRRSRPPDTSSIPSMSLPRPTTPPRTPTLLGQSPSLPPPSPPIAPSDEDTFDLSDFDRWGKAVPTSSPPAQAPSFPSERCNTSTVPAPVQALFTDGPTFVSPPESDAFSEALTAPRVGPNVPSVSPLRPTPDQATPAVRLHPPAASHSAPPRSGGALSNTHPRRNNATMTWDEAPTPAMGTPVLPAEAQPLEAPRPPPPLPPPAPGPQPARPPQTATARNSPSSPRITPDIAPVRRVSPRQEMHERLDVGDFTAALTMAETMLEVDPDDQDALHVAEVCRAKLKAIYINRLGSLNKIPILAVHPSNLRSLSLDHRSGFLLSLIDGMSSIEEIIDIAAMSPLEALRTLYALLTQHVIALRDR